MWFDEFSKQSIPFLHWRVTPLHIALFTPISDQDKISSYDINTISSSQVASINKNVNWGLLFDPITNYLNYHHMSCLADSKEIAN